MNFPFFKPTTIWISGITASGKTTLGQYLFDFLIEKGLRPLEFIDGDEFRKCLDKTYGYSLEDRQIVLSKLVEMVSDKNKKGITIIVSTVSHKKAMREFARSQISQFMEVHLDCAPETCANRDYKGLYQLAKLGEYDVFPGVTEAYEPSDSPELTLKTDHLTIEECTSILYRDVSLFLGLS